eukprot:TRINITY_DN18866_c0_g1_i1.p1 TRINITY_DN18866_c0_g1~~TRINITY_DN18866_c0_g1_i1.p1  ORF type:complete len:513 (-),score=145.95 TRINITY_DN18866_c0_g1_i1:348-1886(-)
MEALAAQDFKKREKRDRKHLLFSGDAGSDEEDADRPKKPLFPKAKKVKEDQYGPSSSNSMVKDDEEPERGPLLAADPRKAAQERASRRRDAPDLSSGGLLGEDDGTGTLDDVAGAEEDLDLDEHEAEAGGIEPFNLKKEREEGYFDAEGNYVEYRMEGDVTDAWLETAQVDPRFAEKAAARAAAADEGDVQRSDAELAAIKRRMADGLLAGETVLEALRRLGGNRQQGAAGRRPGRGKRRQKSGSEEANETAAPEEQRMSAQDKRLFEQLTEDAMKLMDGGEYGVYSEKKETFEREAAGYEALMRARGDAAKDMFADSDEEDEDKTAAAPGAPLPSETKAGPSSAEGVRQNESREATAAGSVSDGPPIPATSTDQEGGDAQAAMQGEGGEKTGRTSAGLEGQPGAADRAAGSLDASEGGADRGEARRTEAGEAGKDEERPLSANAPNGTPATGGGSLEEAGYVYDPSSGYYYSSDAGCYYDSNTGLYCSSSTGLWYLLDEKSGAYTEVTHCP